MTSSIPDNRLALCAGRLLGMVVLVCLLPGCAALQPDVSPEELYGHRASGEDGEGRTTIAVSQPDEDVEYRLFDATFETVTIRPAPMTVNAASNDVPVEVLIKGAFPDACSELHDVTQQRAGNLIFVTLTMRRPQGSVCASVLRPYRYYLDLEGRFVPGPYSLRLNESVHTFEVRPPADS